MTWRNVSLNAKRTPARMNNYLLWGARFVKELESCARSGHGNNWLILNRVNGTQLTGNLFCLNYLLDITNIIHLAMSRGQLPAWVKLGSVIQTANEDFSKKKKSEKLNICYMQIEKSQSEILKERGMWISAEKYTDVRLFSIQKDNDIKVYSFSSAQYKMLPRRMSFSFS